MMEYVARLDPTPFDWGPKLQRLREKRQEVLDTQGAQRREGTVPGGVHTPAQAGA